MMPLDDDAYVASLRAYDEALDWSPDDPRLHELAETTVALSRRMTLPSDLAGWDRISRETVSVIAGHLGVDSPAWRRLDELVTEKLREHAP